MAQNESAVDVVIVTSPYSSGDEVPLRDVEYFDRSCQIGDDIWLGPLNDDLTESVFNACDPRYESFSPTRQYDGAYALVRLRAPSPEALHFDPDRLLSAAVALTRLVHPTSIGFQYAARIRYPAYGGRQIVPGAPTNLNPHAFVSEERANWLNPSDARPLVDLLEAYQRNDAPQRVRSALWNHETAFRSYYIENRWAIIVTGLEALFHVRDERDPRSGRHAGSTRVFAQRASQVAAILGFTNATDARFRESYARRSEIVHGSGVREADREFKELYEMTESLLSSCIRRALVDAHFAAQFASDDSVRAAFPLY